MQPLKVFMESFIFEGVWGWGLEFGSWAPIFQMKEENPMLNVVVSLSAVSKGFSAFCKIKSFSGDFY